MSIFDNSQGMTSDRIQEILTNLINKNSEKAIDNAGYDKTILAKIQYCTDASLAQYKIQYQNGYYTAYSADPTKQYSPGAQVYVKVPGNDLRNRLFIDGLATNDNTQRTYLTNLEGDQQFVKIGTNWIKRIQNPSALNMSSYWDMTKGREIKHYQDEKSSSSNIQLIPEHEIIRYLQDSDGIRIAGEFKTSFDNSRKNQGNYGLRVVLRFSTPSPEEGGSPIISFKTYELDTFNMDGAPFEFTTFREQYDHWEVTAEDRAIFDGVESISLFVKGFPANEETNPPIDIEVRNLSIFAVKRVYDGITNDDYKVAITTPEGYIFNFNSSDEAKLLMEGHFYYRGNELTDNIKFYWAKKNLAVDSVGHPKYNEMFGQGWQCLNESTGTRAAADNPDVQTLQNYAYTMDTYPVGYVGPLEWAPASSIYLPKSICLGRISVIKCCVLYENNRYESAELLIYNYDGYYVLLKSTEGTEFYNGVGTTDIVAGVFKTKYTTGDSGKFNPQLEQQSITNHDLQYIWKYKQDMNQAEPWPILPEAADELYLSQPDWAASGVGDTLDTVEKTNEEVETFLNDLARRTGIDKTLLECCKERFYYYNNWYTSHEDDGSDQYNRAKARRNSIQTKWLKYLDDQYKAQSPNDLHLPVIGPSNVTGKFNLTSTELTDFYKQGKDPFPYAYIDTITPQTSITTPYVDYMRNTVYKFAASKITELGMVEVTVLITKNGITQSLETQSINIKNGQGSGLKYDLQIENGTQCFMYSGGGLAPTERGDASTASVTIRPLTFKIYNQTGELVYNSDDEEQSKIIDQLEPKWKFYNVDTLITTKYDLSSPSCHAIEDEPGRLYLANAAKFYYGLLKDFNVNFKERSNIELTVKYDGQYYTASTNFTFAKQGDLGTNGTNMYLDIDDPVYEQYRSDLLSRDTFNAFKKDNGSVEITQYYSPNERHLKNTYLYATKIYSVSGGQHTLASGYNEGDYCNLLFMKGVNSNHETYSDNDELYKVIGDSKTRLYGYWFENGMQSAVDSNSTWSASSGSAKNIQDQHIMGRSPIYDRASFQFISGGQFERNGSSVDIQLIPPVGITSDTGHTVFYKPMDVTYTELNVDYEWTANNVVCCEAKRTVSEQLDLKGNPITRYCYGYYQIPFFYYGYYEKNNGVYVNHTPDGLDPARHIVITGGYDQILYGADGLNPEYNSQEPFCIHLFDEKGQDITKQAFSSNNLSLEWNSSYGFRKRPITNTNGVYPPSFSSYDSSIDLLNKYCSYNNKYYKCVVSHTKGQVDGAFVAANWREVGKYEFKRNQYFIPPNSYEACAVNSLFNSWISVKIIYMYTETHDGIATDKKIEAAVLLPISVLCNAYGSDEINGWNGHRTQVEDGYIISNKVAAGVKDDQNRFTGITLGKKMITQGTADQNEIGLFGYGKYYDANSNNKSIGWGQTLFLDAETGLAVFGPRGSTQIILNPKVPAEGTANESWSKLAGWYFSPNYLYKPIWADDNYVTGEGSENQPLGNKAYYNLQPPDATGESVPGSVGLYVPGSKAAGQLTSDTVFMWASCSSAVTGLNFDDNGTLQGLKDAINTIVQTFNNTKFLRYYPKIQESRDVVPDILLNACIRNISQLVTFYGLESELNSGSQVSGDVHELSSISTLLTNYQNKFRDYIGAIGDEGGDPQGFDRLTNKVQEIHDTMTNGSFPTQTIDGSTVTMIIPDGVTIENISQIRQWYCNAFIPNLTAEQIDLLSILNRLLNDYDTIYADVVCGPVNDPSAASDPIISALKEAIGAVVDYFEEHPSQIKQIRQTVLNTNAPLLPSLNGAATEITNITELQEKYSVLPVTASDESKTLWNSLFGSNGWILNYISLHNRYIIWEQDIENNSAAAIGYKGDKTKANFYVTYGGKMHCNEADISGTIRAKSGYIGTGNERADQLEICTLRKNDFTDKWEMYLLYNDNFRVKAADAQANVEGSVYINGTIMAKSGQIGNAREGIDGNDAHTTFIEYNWYPRHLPDQYSAWGSAGEVDYRKPKWDLAQGKIVKYALWHPYFSIIDDAGGAYNPAYDPNDPSAPPRHDFDYSDGDAIFIGRMYASGGRLGDWICDEERNILRDPFDTIKLKPVLDPSNRASGYINCSKITIFGDGFIHGGTPDGNELIRNPNQSGAKWWIDSDGIANLILDLDKVQVRYYNSSSREYELDTLKHYIATH